LHTDRLDKLIDAAGRLTSLLSALADLAHAATRGVDWPEPSIDADLEELQSSTDTELLLLVNSLDAAATRYSDTPIAYALIAWNHGIAALRAASRLAELVASRDEPLASLIHSYTEKIRKALAELAIAYTAATSQAETPPPTGVKPNFPPPTEKHGKH